jgi:uncharacterized NAD(P)/FAD-binding protein YdhS
MDMLSQPHGRGLHVVIVGGGASGTLTAAQLLGRPGAPGYGVRVTMIDQHGRHGLGAAYSTEQDDHLLNAVAGQMSAVPDDPEHLIRWANGAGRGFLPTRLAAVTDATFLPRPAYGRYLQHVLSEAEQLTRRVARVTAEAVAIRRRSEGPAMRVFLTDGHLDADVAVLATGNAPAGLPFDVPPDGRVIADPWQPGALGAILAKPLPRSVVIVGTGLTMLDLAVAIAAASPQTAVHAVSRHGLLPRTHPGSMPPADQPLWLPGVFRTTEPARLVELMWQVRSVTAASPANWHHVMSALRPFVPGLWRRMPDDDKRLFLRHLARYWEIHRHLVPPETASRITALQLTGQLTVHKGHVRAVTEAAGRLQVSVGTGGGTAELPADWLVNSTGTTADISATASPLLRDLFRAGLARPDPFGLGVDASIRGEVLDAAGTASDVLYTLGPPLRGLWYETTAIPEIRDQAVALARLITADRSRLARRPGSAA